jgi:two-component system chemotaxis response regulator CheY
MKFLVADDSPTMRRVIVNALNKIGYDDVIEAEDGKEAYAKLLLDSTIDFVVTDWNMPNLDGLSLVKSLRSNEKFKNIPILMVTTRGNQSDVIDALKAKVNNYVVKPFTPEILKSKIDAVLNSIKV